MICASFLILLPVQAAATALAALLTSRAALPEKLETRCRQRIFALLGDEAYPARVWGGRLVAALLKRGAAPLKV